MVQLENGIALKFLLEDRGERLIDAFELDRIVFDEQNRPAILYLLSQRSSSDILEYLLNEHAYVFTVESLFNFLLS